MTYTYKVKIPEIFGEKTYNSIFIGYEDEAGLVRRKDIQYTDQFIFETFDKEIEQIVFLAHDGNDWDNIHEIVPGNICLVNEYDDIILPVLDLDQNVEVNTNEFNERVTVVFIDEDHEEELSKIVHMYNCIGITNIKILNSKTINIPAIKSLEDYSKFCINELYKYVDTEFCLISQWDGFILNYNKFKREFFNYDYIGAPFFYDTKSELGNGGFSLRSKKFLTTIAEIFRGRVIDDNEDLFLQKHVKLLKKANLKFAPFNVKDAFSVENQHYSGQFGFHGFMTKGLSPAAKQFYNNKFHHSGDLGDLIFSLPTIKALGGGVLIISNDIAYFQKRQMFNMDIIQQLRQFLNKQDYLVEVYSDTRLPCDIDYDLNKFRYRQFLHFVGRLQGNELQNFEDNWKLTTITQLHLKAFDCDSNSDVEPWLKWNKKTIFDNKPIIINRTARYQNPHFPWKEICDHYRDYIYFVGHEDEYKEFVKLYGDVDYVSTPSIISLVEIIIGSKLLIGNMSFPVAIAEGFKHNCLVESGLDVRSNNYVRHNIYVPNPDNIKVDKVLDYIKEYVGF